MRSSQEFSPENSFANFSDFSEKMNKLLALLSALSLADQRPCEHSDTLARLRKLMENRGYGNMG